MLTDNIQKLEKKKTITVKDTIRRMILKDLMQLKYLYVIL